MRFDGNQSLHSLKFYFQIEIVSQYKVSVLVGDLTLPPPPPRDKYSVGMVIFQDDCFSKELISITKMNS